MVALEGLEPPTLGFEDRCSIQLNYRTNTLFSLEQLIILKNN